MNTGDFVEYLVRLTVAYLITRYYIEINKNEFNEQEYSGESTDVSFLNKLYRQLQLLIYSREDITKLNSINMSLLELKNDKTIAYTSYFIMKFFLFIPSFAFLVYLNSMYDFIFHGQIKVFVIIFSTITLLSLLLLIAVEIITKIFKVEKKQLWYQIVTYFFKTISTFDYRVVYVVFKFVFSNKTVVEN